MLHFQTDDFFKTKTCGKQDEFTMEIQNEWLSKPLSKQSYFVTHIVSYYRTDEVIQSFNNYVKKDYFDPIVNKVILSMFDIEIE